MKIGLTEIIIGAGLLYLLTQKKDSALPPQKESYPVLPGQKPALPYSTQSLYTNPPAGLLGLVPPVKDTATYTQRVAGLGTSTELQARFKNLNRGWSSGFELVPYNGYDLTPFNPITRVANYTL